MRGQFLRMRWRGTFAILFIECPVSDDGMERFACPTADRMGRYHCIDDHVLCDGFIDCPTGEDEDRQACMFYKTVSRIAINLSCIFCRNVKIWILTINSLLKSTPKLNEMYRARQHSYLIMRTLCSLFFASKTDLYNSGIVCKFP